MRLNGIQCDQCKKQHLFSSKASAIIDITSGMLPKEWLKVECGRVGEIAISYEPLLFCGDMCLFNWVASRVQQTQEGDLEEVAL